MPRVGSNNRGDLIVHCLLLEVPKKLSKKQRELLEQLAAEFGETHSEHKTVTQKLKELARRIAVSAHRFFLTAPLESDTGRLLPLSDADVHHAADVLRIASVNRSTSSSRMRACGGSRSSPLRDAA